MTENIDNLKFVLGKDNSPKNDETFNNFNTLTSTKDKSYPNSPTASKKLLGLRKGSQQTLDPILNRKNSTFNDKNLFNGLNDKKTIQLKVAVRFRPYNLVEINHIANNSSDGKDTNKCYEIIGNNTILLKYQHNKSYFTLDRAFDSTASQDEIFEEIGKETIEEVIKGYNGTIFTYGQSGSGKTFTMYGDDITSIKNRGIVPRTIDYIFNYVNEERNFDTKFEIKLSMLEIYKESLYDLLNPDADNSLKIKEHSKRGIYVQNLTEEYISDFNEFIELVEEAEKYRVVAETLLNKNSSRSHVVLNIELLQKLPDGVEKEAF